MLHNWPHLYENGLVDVMTIAGGRQGAGWLLSPYEAYTEVAATSVALPHNVVPYRAS